MSAIRARPSSSEGGISWDLAIGGLIKSQQLTEREAISQSEVDGRVWGNIHPHLQQRSTQILGEEFVSIWLHRVRVR